MRSKPARSGTRSKQARTAESPRRPTSVTPAVPGTYREFVSRFPELGAFHERVANAVELVGPLDAKSRSLVKIGISLGAGLESALRSHVRRAIEQGATEAEVEQAILLGMNTVGFPRTVAAWSWARQQFERGA